MAGGVGPEVDFASGVVVWAPGDVGDGDAGGDDVLQVVEVEGEAV